MPGDTPVWRYLSLDAVIATIKTRRLRLTRIDKFQDPFEGSVPNAQFDQQQTVLLIGAESRRHMWNQIAPHHPGMAASMPPYEDSWTRITRWRRARTRSAHASCWSHGDESELLWRLYCRHESSQGVGLLWRLCSRHKGSQGVGVALRTTLACLDASVKAHDLYVSPIIYDRYHEALPFTDEMDSLLHKRHLFAPEHELRLLKFDQAHFNALIPKDASVSELPEHIPVDWVLSDVIDKIVISPYADENYEHLVRAAINAADPNLASRVVLSVLNDRPRF
jgi:hypothetical protein